MIQDCEAGEKEKEREREGGEEERTLRRLRV